MMAMVWLKRETTNSDKDKDGWEQSSESRQTFMQSQRHTSKTSRSKVECHFSQLVVLIYCFGGKGRDKLRVLRSSPIASDRGAR